MPLNSLFAQITGDLQRRDPRLEKNLDALCEASYQRDFNSISVARAFSMLSRFAKNNPNRCDAIKAHRSFVPRMMQVAQQQIQGNLCNARSFANLLYGCMSLGITPDAAWQTTFWQHSQGKLNDFNPQALSSTLYAAANLSLTPPEDWQKAFWKQSKHQLRQFNPQDMINMLYAACVLDLKIPETVKPLVQSTVTSNTEEDIRHLHAMYSAKDYLEAQGINLVFKENTPEKLRQSEDTHVSHLEKKTGFALAKVLQSMRPQTLLNAQHFIDATASPVDFFIESCGDQGLVIQVDGPYHFLDKGTERQCVNGFTAFQTRYFKKAGYQVLRLPYDLLNKYGVYDIEDENSPVPKALAAYLKEQLTPYLALTT